MSKLKTLKVHDSGRSGDYIAPSFANGCTGACSYCYVARYKQTNPITIYTNLDEIETTIKNFVNALPNKTPNQADKIYWTFDIGCNSDVSVDSYINSSIYRLLNNVPNNVKYTFATKFINEELLTEVNASEQLRIRYSLMPPKYAKQVDVRTESISKRIQAAQMFFDNGWEVHLNFSPVIITNTWVKDWSEFFKTLDKQFSDDFKHQCKSEVIMLTHHKGLHEKNKIWNPKGENILYSPDLQVEKVTQRGSAALRYKLDYKKIYVQQFKDLVNKYIPWCEIRYIF